MEAGPHLARDHAGSCSSFGTGNLYGQSLRRGFQARAGRAAARGRPPRRGPGDRIELVAANPQNLVWGTDWPHPRPEGPVPDAARLRDVFLDWTRDPDTRQAILTDNPARLYDFPKI